jgi:hypothetical protein
LALDYVVTNNDLRASESSLAGWPRIVFKALEAANFPGPFAFHAAVVSIDLLFDSTQSLGRIARRMSRVNGAIGRGKSAQAKTSRLS